VVALGIIGTLVMTEGDRLTHRPDAGLVSGFEGVDVGHRLRVSLLRADVEQGFSDSRRVGAVRLDAHCGYLPWSELLSVCEPHSWPMNEQHSSRMCR
jgi:hypothetical protein